jgi:hypothetical protein
MANVIIRFSVYSNSDESNIEDLKIKLPAPTSYVSIGEIKTLLNGNKGIPSAVTSYDYEYSFENIVDIDIPNNLFYDKWKDNIDVLKKLVTDYKYQLSVDYQITIFNLEYPSLFFQSKYLSFLGELSAILSFYYYND